MSRISLRRCIGFIGLLFLTLAACAPEAGTVGSVQVLGSLPQSVSSADISEVRVTVTAADMSPRTASLTLTGSSWSGTLEGIPAGTLRTFSAEALDASGTRLYAGQATDVTILAGVTTVVSILLQQVTPPTPFENAAPSITSLTVTPGTVAPGGSVSLKASAQDVNAADTLAYAWTASAGSFSAASSLSTTWTAPAVPGPVTLTFTVTDPHGSSATVSFTLTVANAGSAEVEVRINTWPQVSGVNATPTAVEVGESTTVVATASDSDGDVLQYQWSASCAGTWADATSATATFTPSTLPAGETCPNCALTVTAKDGRGGQSTGTLSICVGSKPTAKFPPNIMEAWRSASSVGAGGSVTLGMKAVDPQDSALSFSWTASTGTLSTPADTATTSEVLWTAPACVPAGVSPTITATVSNALGLSAATSFSFTGIPSCPTAVCGDGTLDEGETCDDGNGSNEDNCLAMCVLASCGDGYVDGQSPSIEQCDTAGESSACDSDCTVRVCGDGLVNASAGEQCDNTGGVDSAGCDADCTIAFCGDHYVNTPRGEQCDTGGSTATCDADCTVSACGDGFLNPAVGEQCDTAGSSASCDTDCTAALCGDGFINPSAGEACDDGNTVTETSCPYGTMSCVSCNATCTAPLNLTGSFCGDGLVSSGEVCDDGNTVTETSCPYGTMSCVSCNATCTATLNLTGSFCGDGLVSSGEVCDDGNTVTETACPYGTMSCVSCNATCTATLNLTGP